MSSLLSRVLFLVVLFAIGCAPTTMAQPFDMFQGRHIKKFDTRITTKDNWVVLQVRPAVTRGDVRDTKRWRIYGILVCYKYNGEQKAVRQDMTRKLVGGNSLYEYTLAYTTSANVTDVSYEFFDASKPSSTFPEKSSCY